LTKVALLPFFLPHLIRSLFKNMSVNLSRVFQII
jgi:hypothetical protein